MVTASHLYERNDHDSQNPKKNTKFSYSCAELFYERLREHFQQINTTPIVTKSFYCTSFIFTALLLACSLYM